MYSIDNAQALTAQQEYCWFGAYRSTFDAIASLESAGMALLALGSDTLWQADGMRALNAAIDDIGAQCGVLANDLRNRLWELEVAR